jgi:hypothetical protein
MVVVGFQSDGGGRLQAVRRRRPDFQAPARDGRRLHGHRKFTGDSQTRPPGHQSRRGKLRNEEESKGDSLGSSEGRERRRRSGSGRRGGAPAALRCGGAAQARRGRGGGADGEGARGGFIGRRGKGKGHGEAVGEVGGSRRH